MPANTSGIRLGRHHPHRLGLEHRPGLEHIGHGDPLVLEQDGGVPCRHSGIGAIDTSTGTAPAEPDEALRLEDPKRLAHGGPRHVEANHELCFWGQELTILQFAEHDLASQGVGDQLADLLSTQTIGAGMVHVVVCGVINLSGPNPSRIVAGVPFQLGDAGTAPG